MGTMKIIGKAERKCRVRKSDVSAFKHAMKLLKDHAFSNKEYEYIEVCQTMEAEL